ncbi:MAG: nicotinate-nucleotide adenylyltransferase [Nitriliruptoraceae bacterium]
MTTRRIGLFGGSFDPPHNGHLKVAEAARATLKLDEVRFVVAARPWMKSTVASPIQRVAMTQLLIGDTPGLVVDASELDRDGPTYTVDTLEAIAAQQPDAELVFLLGVDTAAQLASWHRVDDALSLAQFVVLTRPGYQPDGSITLPVIDVPELAISSAEIRARLENGDDVARLIPATVLSYIAEHGLYTQA